MKNLITLLTYSRTVLLSFALMTAAPAPGGELGSNSGSQQLAFKSRKESLLQFSFITIKKWWCSAKNKLIKQYSVFWMKILCHNKMITRNYLVILMTLGTFCDPIMAFWGDDIVPRLRVNYLSQSTGKKIPKKSIRNYQLLLIIRI